MKTFCQQKAADSWRKAHMIEWLNLWQQIARKYSSFQFDQEKKAFHLRAVCQTAPWHVSLAAHFVCDKTNQEGGRSNVNNSGLFHKRDLFGCDIPGSPRKMWNISGTVSLAVDQGYRSKIISCPFKLWNIDQKKKSFREFKISSVTNISQSEALLDSRPTSSFSFGERSRQELRNNSTFYQLRYFHTTKGKVTTWPFVASL